MTDQTLDPTHTDGPLETHQHWAIMLRDLASGNTQLIDTAWSEPQARELLEQYFEQQPENTEFYAEERNDLRHPAWH